MKLTRQQKQLLIETHPDRNGGDHSRLEKFFAALKRPSQSLTHKVYCRVCGVRVSGVARACRTHWRIKSLLTTTAACLVLMASGAQKGAELLMTKPVTRSTFLPVITQTVSQPAMIPVPLAWDTSQGATTYSLYWSMDQTVWLSMSGLTTNFAMLSIPALPAWFKVTASNTDGESDFSSTLRVAQDSVNEVRYETTPDLTAPVWTDRGTVFRGTNQTGMGFYRLKISNSNQWNTVSTP